jgi:hypothetical protein
MEKRLVPTFRRSPGHCGFGDDFDDGVPLSSGTVLQLEITLKPKKGDFQCQKQL